MEVYSLIPFLYVAITSFWFNLEKYQDKYKNESLKTLYIYYSVVSALCINSSRLFCDLAVLESMA